MSVNINEESPVINMNIKKMQQLVDDKITKDKLNGLKNLVQELNQKVRALKESKDDGLKKRVLLNRIEQLNLQIDIISNQISNKNWQTIKTRLEDVSNKSQMVINKIRFITIIICVIIIILIISVTFNVKRLTKDIRLKSQSANHKAKLLEESAKEMKESSDEVEKQVNNAFKSLKGLKMGNNNLAVQVQEVSFFMKNITEKIKELSNSSFVIYECSGDTYNFIKSINEKIELGNALLNSIFEVTKDFKGSIGRISKISDNIISISEQTNLLALNAAIEAARSSGTKGNNSQGFTVVAEEIKNLANDSRKASEEVKNIIFDIESDFEKILAKMVFKTDLNQENLMEVFEGIRASSDELISRMDMFKVLSKEQLDLNKETEELSEGIFSFSQKVSDHSQSILVVTDELNFILDELIKMRLNLEEKIKQQFYNIGSQSVLIEEINLANNYLK